MIIDHIMVVPGIGRSGACSKLAIEIAPGFFATQRKKSSLDLIFQQASKPCSETRDKRKKTAQFSKDIYTHGKKRFTRKNKIFGLYLLKKKKIKYIYI